MFDKNCVQNKYGESKKTIADQQESKLQEQNLAAFTCRAALYGCETRGIVETRQKGKLEAMKMRIWRRILRIS